MSELIISGRYLKNLKKKESEDGNLIEDILIDVQKIYLRVFKYKDGKIYAFQYTDRINKSGGNNYSCFEVKLVQKTKSIWEEVQEEGEDC